MYGKVTQDSVLGLGEQDKAMHARPWDARPFIPPLLPDGNGGSLRPKPEVRDVIAREVVLTLKNVFLDFLSDALKKSKEEEEENHEEKVYDSDGDEVNAGLNTRGCTYKFCPGNEIDRVENEFLIFKGGNKTHRNTLPDSTSWLNWMNLRSQERMSTKRAQNAELHRGECRAGSTMCFKCGKPRHYSKDCRSTIKCQNYGWFGHVTKDCRKTGQSGSGKEKEDEKEQPKARTRAYALTKEEARGNPDVV
ncbi:hypothetical protein L1987_13636 [Smallanthus sonchifolius]|uniref:Uncharacterized protein n=1 Tax=Smallanthus sonchifolius TaxID=185202 RepID=A0ACB9JHX2_9ASTR|nr:hypothetical protein L1987_13636 [Smallanthus sonchifolius]